MNYVLDRVQIPSGKRGDMSRPCAYLRMSFLRVLPTVGPPAVSARSGRVRSPLREVATRPFAKLLRAVLLLLARRSLSA